MNDKNNLVGDIRFENVDFKYPTRDILVVEDLTCVARTGQTTALVGSIGSGK